ncbi:MAG: hypothetical protein KAW41_00660 [Candidatus Diapherotrites archaeon]|nr:hypothetical protein [Candidatus Diapherotrites archaeon]
MGLKIRHGNEEQLRKDITNFAKFTKPVYIHSKEIRTHIDLKEAQELCDLMDEISTASSKHYEENYLGDQDYTENKDKVYKLLKTSSKYCLNYLVTLIGEGGGILKQDFVDRLHNLQGLPQVRSVLEQLKDPSQQE